MMNRITTKINTKEISSIQIHLQRKAFYYYYGKIWGLFGKNAIRHVADAFTWPSIVDIDEIRQYGLYIISEFAKEVYYKPHMYIVMNNKTSHVVRFNTSEELLSFVDRIKENEWLEFTNDKLYF